MLLSRPRLRATPGIPAYLAIILVGAVFCALAAGRLYEAHRIRAEGVQVSATVLGFEPFGGRSVYLTYAYDVSGRRYEVREVVSNRLRNALAPGDAMAVWIVPGQPTEPLIDRPGTPSPWIGFGVGLLCLIGGIFGLVQLLSRRRARTGRRGTA